MRLRIGLFDMGSGVYIQMGKKFALLYVGHDGNLLYITGNQIFYIQKTFFSASCMYLSNLEPNFSKQKNYFTYIN